MGKFWIEVCLISARGLQRSVSLWKRQWYAVGWVDPKSKYCTKIDASGNVNPFWRTKFSFLLDDDASEQSLQDLALNVQVFSRDPFFLTEKLQGSATIMLKEFLAKHVNNSQTSGNEELGSYQLRKKKSNEPRGFIDISIRISDDKEEPNMFQGSEGGIFVLDPGRNTNMTTPGGLEQPHLQQQQVPPATIHRPENLQQQPNMSSYPKPYPTNYPNPYVGGPSYYAQAGPSHQPPPPPHVGYNPTMLPRTEYINMPSSSSSGVGPAAQRGGVPAGFAIGAGAGALAAGAVMFGGDFMSAAHNFPPGLGDASVTIATDPLF
ncbi:hypothetical protein K1719_018169 [Acacia pycnantha]|nr:hypothetical protein K1719_018169 [Acacia pycnantha]